MNSTVLLGLRVAVVSYDVRELRLWQSFLASNCPGVRCTVYRRGEDVLRVLRSGGGCECVVLGNQLDDMDARSFLVCLNGLAKRPIIFSAGDGYHAASMGASLSGDASKTYIVHSRVCLQDLVSQLCGQVGSGEDSLRRVCVQYYRLWAVPAQDRGSEYLTRAMHIVCAAPEKLAVRKEILGVVAEQEKVTQGAIDSALRRLIDGLEVRAVPEWLAFKQAHGLDECSVTPGKLIYALRDELLYGSRKV